MHHSVLVVLTLLGLCATTADISVVLRSHIAIPLKNRTQMVVPSQVMI